MLRWADCTHLFPAGVGIGGGSRNFSHFAYSESAKQVTLNRATDGQKKKLCIVRHNYSLGQVRKADLMFEEATFRNESPGDMGLRLKLVARQHALKRLIKHQKSTDTLMTCKIPPSERIDSYDAFEVWIKPRPKGSHSKSKVRSSTPPFKVCTDDEVEAANTKIREYIRKVDNTIKKPISTSLNRHLKVLSSGYEILPKKSLILKSDSLSYEPYMKYHVGRLSNLLHLLVLRQDWKRAYKCFSLLIRQRNIDLRSIWGIGVEILTRLNELKFTDHLQEFGEDFHLDEYDIRLLSVLRNKDLIPDQNLRGSLLDFTPDSRLDKFLTWMHVYYGVKYFYSYNDQSWELKHYLYGAELEENESAPEDTENEPNNKHPKKNSDKLSMAWRLPPAFRTGSKTHTPLYVTTMVWHLIISLDLDRAEEVLSELLLEPPFNSDGMYFYLTGLVKFLKIQVALDSNGPVDPIKGWAQECRGLWDKAQSNKLEFPLAELLKHLETFESRAANLDIHSSPDDSDKFSEEVQSSPISLTALESPQLNAIDSTDEDNLGISF